MISRPRAKKPLAPMQYAVAQLARREHSRAELKVRLLRRLRGEAEAGEAAALAEKILDELQSKGLLSDARFVATLTRTRAQRFGTARIRQELREHELPDELVRPALDELKATEEKRARDLWMRRFGRVATDSAERTRQMRFLAQRGFSTAVVIRVVRSPPEDD